MIPLVEGWKYFRVEVGRGTRYEVRVTRLKAGRHCISLRPLRPLRLIERGEKREARSEKGISAGLYCISLRPLRLLFRAPQLLAAGVYYVACGDAGRSSWVAQRGLRASSVLGMVHRRWSTVHRRSPSIHPAWSYLFQPGNIFFAGLLPPTLRYGRQAG